MSALPPDLAPWSAELESLPVELAIAIGPWLKRLSVAIGPLRRRTLGRIGEVDGFEGIGRRGNAEHLLASEWLLAHEVPMEFLRRAAESELSYLQLARHEPVAGGCCVALFDCGPDQAGAPRLAQLALLVVLARRAGSAGARFAWGVAQATDSTLADEVSAQSIATLLSRRSVRSVDPDDVEAWSGMLPRDPGPEELWWIGAPGPGVRSDLDVAQRRWLPPLSRIETVDLLKPGARAVSVRLRPQRSAGTIQVDLPLPDDHAAVRLLRDPYGVARGPTRRSVRGIGNASGWIFSGNGRRLLVANADGGVSVFYVLHSPRETAPKQLVVHTEINEPTVAVQFAKSRTFVLVAEAARLRLRSDSGSVLFTLPVDWTPPREGEPLRACWHRRYRREPCLFFVDGAGTLYRLPYRQEGAQPDKWLEDVEFLTLANGSLRCLQRTPQGLCEVSGDEPDRFFRARELNVEGSIAEGTLAVAQCPHQHLLTCAVETAPGQWSIFTSDRRGSHVVPAGPGTTVHGLVCAEGRPYLVGLPASGHAIILLDALGEQDPIRLHPVAPVAAIQCSSLHPRLAYATRGGDLVVLDLPSGEIRLQLTDTAP